MPPLGPGVSTPVRPSAGRRIEAVKILHRKHGIDAVGRFRGKRQSWRGINTDLEFRQIALRAVFRINCRLDDPQVFGLEAAHVRVG